MIAAIDGCREGWIIAIADRWPSNEPIQLIHAADFTGCISKTVLCRAVMVDMPIGLPSGSTSEARLCDLEARAMLKGASSTIFCAPPRCTLSAKNPAEFQRVHHAATGKGAGLPVWGIVPKLREVDSTMTQNPALQERVREFHPELAWRRCAGQRSLDSKHTGAGLLRRLSILNQASPNWLGDTSGLTLPKRFKLDDVLDAVIGLAVAQAIVDGSPAHCQRRLPPGDPPVDEFGLRMEIWY